MLVRVNKTGGAVDETIQVGARELNIRFGADEDDVFAVSVTDLTLNIGDFVTIEGDVAFSGGTFAGAGLSVFLGRGPAHLANGDLNPLAIGVLLSNGRIGLIQAAERLRARRRGRRQPRRHHRRHDLRPRIGAREHDGRRSTRTLSIPGSTADPDRAEVHEHRRRQELRRHRRADRSPRPDLSGNFSFESTAAGDVAIAATNVTSRSPASASRTAPARCCSRRRASRAGSAAPLAVTIPGINFGGTFGVAVNTTAAAVNRTFDVGGDEVVLNVPAGPVPARRGPRVTLTSSASRSAATSRVERSGTTTTIAARNVSFSLGAGSSAVR